MATPHIGANKGDIAETILLPGDPLRAKFIAENFLENVTQYNSIRNMFGFTGTYKGKKVSVQGTGMGMPSCSIYSYELIHFYGCKNLIRIGTAGALVDKLHIGDLVIGMGACTDSNYASQYELPGTYAPIASYELLRKAVNKADEMKINYHVGNIVSSDVFYGANNATPKYITIDSENEQFEISHSGGGPGKTDCARRVSRQAPDRAGTRIGISGIQADRDACAARADSERPSETGRPPGNPDCAAGKIFRNHCDCRQRRHEHSGNRPPSQGTAGADQPRRIRIHPDRRHRLDQFPQSVQAARQSLFRNHLHEQHFVL